MEELPFESQSFNAIVSQFGVEFGLLSQVCTEISRVIKPEGIISVLSVPARSPLFEGFIKKGKQSQFVLNNTRLFEVATAVAQAIHSFESSGQGREPAAYLQRFSAEVESVLSKVEEANSGLIVAVVATLQDILTRRGQLSIQEQITYIEHLKSRLNDHVARCESVSRAALGDASLTALTRGIPTVNPKGCRAEPISVGSFGTVAWHVSN